MKKFIISAIVNITLLVLLMKIFKLLDSYNIWMFILTIEFILGIILLFLKKNRMIGYGILSSLFLFFLGIVLIINALGG